jgi:hypothetical protein
LKSTGICQIGKLWETVSMIKENFTPKKGQIVLAQGNTGTFKVIDVSADGTAAIQSFSLSKQKLLGGVLYGIPCTTLLPFKEDASQAAARIVKEATEGQ